MTHTPHTEAPLSEQLEKVQEAISALAPFELVQGDAIQRTNPSSGQMLNSNLAWAVSSGKLRSGHKTKRAIQDLHDGLDALPAIIQQAAALERQLASRPSTETVERVAKALCRYEHGPANFGYAWQSWHTNFESLAEVAIAALSLPPEHKEK